MGSKNSTLAFTFRCQGEIKWTSPEEMVTNEVGRGWGGWKSLQTIMQVEEERKTRCRHRGTP
jgi:hypothetical protein